jgi:aryl-alcohol dehydrogenase-like predicted oxidoreductase
MDSLHILVEQSKVLYLGISDSPAWVVAAANTYAKQAHKTPFSVYQGQWNVMKRDLEHEIMPMARHFGMAICPWDVAGGGRFKTKKMIEEKKKAGEGVRSMFGVEQTNDEAKISEALEKVAEEHGGASITAIAIAYVMQKTRYVVPIIGGRKVEHLMDNIKALSIHLTDQQIEYLESVVPSHVPFPIVHIGEDPHETGKSMLVASTAQIAWQQNGKPIGHE